MDTELLQTTCLLPGQTLCTAIDAGAVLRVVQGRVELSLPPDWLAESLVGPRTLLEEGQGHVLERAGWIGVRALSPARVQTVAAPAPQWSAAVARLLRLVQRLPGVGARPASR